MPLKIADSGPAGISAINRWAEQHENTVNGHTTQLNQLNSLVAKLFKLNPSLVKPGATSKRS